MAIKKEVQFAVTDYGSTPEREPDVAPPSPRTRVGRPELVEPAAGDGSPDLLPPPATAPKRTASRRRRLGHSFSRRTGPFRKAWVKTFGEETNWTTKWTMSCCLLVALLIMVGHHLYFADLAREDVGDSFTQLKTRAFGNVFPYIVLAFMLGSVTIAYTQYLFLRLGRRPVPVRVVDAAYSAAGSLFFLFSWEMLRELPDIGAFALFIGLLTVPTTMVTPGTLTVQQAQLPGNVTRPVYPLAIANWSKSSYFELSRPANAEGNPNDRNKLLWVSYRTIISRLTNAAASSGQILPLKAEAPNSSYPLSFFGPYVECEEAPENVAALIRANTAAVAAKHHNATLVEDLYVAYVPDLSSEDPALWGQPSERSVDPSRGSNELWLSYKSNGTDGEGWKRWPYPKCAFTEYRVCRLMNASYELNVSFSNGAMTVTHLNGKPTVLDRTPVPYPKRIVNGTDPDQLTEMAYSAYFFAFTDLLIGSMGFYKEAFVGEGENITASFTNIDTRVKDSALIGSKDYDCFFSFSWYFSNKTWDAPSDQRAYDISFARSGASLDTLLPELAANQTISLMSDLLLTAPVPGTHTIYSTVDLWDYHPANLLIAYGAAFIMALIANVLGWLAFEKNGTNVDLSFSFTLTMAPHLKILKDGHERRRGSLPLPQDSKARRVWFGQHVSGGGYGFHEVTNLEEHLRWERMRSAMSRYGRRRRRGSRREPSMV